jgi:hypothetical protein
MDRVPSLVLDGVELSRFEVERTSPHACRAKQTHFAAPMVKLGFTVRGRTTLRGTGPRPRGDLSSGFLRWPGSMGYHFDLACRCLSRKATKSTLMDALFGVGEIGGA